MEGAYTPEFTPVAQRGHVVELDFGSERRTYEVNQVAPLPVIETQEITVSDGDRETNIDLESLEVWDDWFAQYRLPRLSTELPDDVSLQFDQGGSQSPLYQNLNQRGKIDNQTPVQSVSDADGNVDVESLTHLLEQYVYEQETPQMTVENASGSEVTFTLSYSGWAYQVSSASPDGQPTYIPVESIRGE